MKVVLAGIYETNTVSLAPQVLKSYVGQFDELRDVEVVTREFSIFDHPVESTIQGLVEERPDVVGFSTYIWNINEILEIIKFLPTKVVLGGPQLTGLEKRLLAGNPDIDVVVTGEGEVPFRQLLEHFIGRRELYDVSGITTRDFQTPKPEPIPLDDIPPFYDRIFRENPDLTWINIETSRGCPFGCKFCAWGYDKSMRYASVDRVKQDLDSIMAQDGITDIVFCDSSLLLKKDRARQILRHMIDSGMNKSARYEFDAEYLDDETIDILGELPEHEFNFGLQTVNQDVLKTMDRRWRQERWEDRYAMITRKLPGVKITIDLIYGLPDDDIEGYKRSLDYGISLPNVTRILTNPLICLPGADFFTEQEKHGIVLRDDNSYIVRATRTFPEEQMDEARRLSFYVATIFLNRSLRDSIKAYAEDTGRRYIDTVIEFMESLPFELSDATYPDMIPTIKEGFKQRNSTFRTVTGRYGEIVDHFREVTGGEYDGRLLGYEDQFTEHFYKLKRFAQSQIETEQEELLSTIA